MSIHRRKCFITIHNTCLAEENCVMNGMIARTQMLSIKDCLNISKWLTQSSGVWIRASVGIVLCLSSTLSWARDRPICSLESPQTSLSVRQKLQRTKSSWLIPTAYAGLRSPKKLLRDVPSGKMLRIYSQGVLTTATYIEEALLRTRLSQKSPNRIEGLMVIGDSLSATSHFLACLESNRVAGIKPRWLKSIEGWRRRRQFGVLKRHSFAAQHGATSWEVLTPRVYRTKGGYGSKRESLFHKESQKLSPLERELFSNPARYASVLLGSNDLHYHRGFERFAWRYLQLVESLLDAGVYPILHTLPPQRLAYETHQTSVDDFNQLIKAIAATERVPLIDLNRSLKSLRRLGLRRDGLHLNAYAGGCRLTQKGLRFGQNLRNYIFLEAYSMLRKRERSLFEAMDDQRIASKSALMNTAISTVRLNSDLSSQKTPCFRELQKRSKRALRWKKAKRRDQDRRDQMGPPLHSHGEWRMEHFSLKLARPKRLRVIALLNPGQKKDLSESQLWLHLSDGRCIALSKSLERLNLPSGFHSIFHFSRFNELARKKTESIYSTALLSW